MNTIDTCTHSVFDAIFGDYKCEMMHKTIYNPEYCAMCDLYKARKKGEEQKISKQEYNDD